MASGSFCSLALGFRSTASPTMMSTVAAAMAPITAAGTQMFVDFSGLRRRRARGGLSSSPASSRMSSRDPTRLLGDPARARTFAGSATAFSGISSRNVATGRGDRGGTAAGLDGSSGAGSLAAGAITGGPGTRKTLPHSMQRTNLPPAIGWTAYWMAPQSVQVSRGPEDPAEGVRSNFVAMKIVVHCGQRTKRPSGDSPETFRVVPQSVHVTRISVMHVS